jgi:very-short-patch-repair endonuclease
MLEARKETRGRFRTNQRVAKVMGRGSHEIGLIAEDMRLVIEIDGEQHRTLTQTRRAASVRDYCSGKSTHFCSDVDIPLSG